MGVLKKRRQPKSPASHQPAAAARRRPGTDADRSSGQSAGAFSYYSRRSENVTNTGRETAEQSGGRPAMLHGYQEAGKPRPLHWLAAIAIVIGGLYLMYLSPQPRIILDKDAATEHFLQPSSVYADAAQHALGSSLLNRLKPTADTTQVQRDLLQNYPEIEQAIVVLPLISHDPRITIKPYSPSFILTTPSNTAFLLDETGRALASASQVADIDQLAVLTLHDKADIHVKLGDRAVPGSTVNFVQSVVSALKASHVDITSLTLSSAFQLDVSVAGASYYTKYNIQAEPLQQAGTFLAIKDRLSQDRAVPVEYIDVRVPGRAYYK